MSGTRERPPREYKFVVLNTRFSCSRLSATRHQGTGRTGRDRENDSDRGTVQAGLLRVFDRDHAVSGRGPRVPAQPRAVSVAHQPFAKPLRSNRQR